MNSNAYKQDTHLGFVVTYQHGRDGTKIKEKLFDVKSTLLGFLPVVNLPKAFSLL